MRTRQEIATAFARREEMGAHQSYFLVGIGGAGMAGVARLLKARGFKVQGTDFTESEVTQALIAEGIFVQIGHSAEKIGPDDALILSDAIPLDASPEVDRARELGLSIFRRSQALGWLLEDKRVIAVTGSHGKTTTTGMIWAGLEAAGANPTAVVGAEIPGLGSSVAIGSGEWAVVEACEAYDSLHDFDPEIAVLLNLELDHIDFHENWENLAESIRRFANRARILIYNESDSGAREIAKEVATTALPFRPDDGLGVPLRQKGRHNQANASAALSALQAAGFDDSVQKGIAQFGGAKRRLQIHFDGDWPGFGRLTVIDDYGHHPTEIEQALRAIRESWGADGRRLLVVFQPHLYSRTAPLIEEFARALDLADVVVLTDIYPARENPIPGVSSWRIAEKCVKPVRYVPARQQLPTKVAQMVQPGDIVVGMGAGNIEYFVPGFLREMERTNRPARILVASGGISPEREVSLHSGAAVLHALQELGYQAEQADLLAELIEGKVGRLIGPNRPDLVFIAMHGEGAEDGRLQGLLDLLSMPYTGSDVLASARAMNKAETKSALEQSGLRVPRGITVSDSAAKIDFQVPCVVKPNGQGSTVGLSFVDHPDDLPKAIDLALSYADSALIEERVVGLEISVPVLGRRALLPVEIVPRTGGYDFANKYIPGATNEICPPEHLSREQVESAQAAALVAHQALGCRGITRTDMIVTKDEIVVLELNTIPGMTETSLVRKSAEAEGMSFNDLVQKIVEEAIANSKNA